MSHMSSLPVLIDADPALFSRERQAAFLAALAGTGNVRSASARAGVSHQTAYRTRLASPGFRRAWDAALLAARAQAEEVLACRAPISSWKELGVGGGRALSRRSGGYAAALFGPVAAGAPGAARQAVRRCRSGGVCVNPCSGPLRILREPFLPWHTGPAGLALGPTRRIPGRARWRTGLSNWNGWRSCTKTGC